jgi:polar amino acid transport system substrate-binding protein
MAKILCTVLAVLCAAPALANDIVPGGTLRAVYLGSNPAQAMRDPATGEIRGASFELARELARRNNIPFEFKPIAGPPAVIEAVKNGEADIGFVAYEATRVGTVEFSKTYMLVRQSFLVLDGSSIREIADIDRPSLKIAGTLNDSITLCMKRILKRATLVELENNAAEISRRLLAREIDAIGANRQRLTTLSKATPGTRLLPDDLFACRRPSSCRKDTRPRSPQSTRSSTTCRGRDFCRPRSTAAARSASRSTTASGPPVARVSVRSRVPDERGEARATIRDPGLPKISNV